MKNKYLILLVVGVAICGLAWVSVLTASPDSYEDCVLKNMKGVESDRVASIIAYTCRDKFPDVISEEEFMGK